LNQDPLGEAGGINLHGFVFNNPNYFVDTDGRAAWGAWIARGGWAIGTAIGSSYLFKKYVSPHIDQVVEDIYLWDPYAGAVAEVSGDALEVVNAVKNLPGKALGRVVCSKPALSSYKKALEIVHELIGKLPKGKPGKWGTPQAGDKYKGYRLDNPHPPSEAHPPGSAGTKIHFDWWDRPSGKRKGPESKQGKVAVED